ncbi:nitroreductase family protein [Microbacterium sp. NPDC091313]
MTAKTRIRPDRAVETSAPVAPALAERWSPRAFDASHRLSDDDVASLFEAARLAPSAFNSQPRRFIVGRAGTPGFERVHATLNERNRIWAASAALLIVNIAVRGDGDRENRWAEYDLGQAVAHLSVQAHELGLHTHQVGGIDPAAIVAAFALPEQWEPVSVTAVGALAEPDHLPEPLRTWEGRQRERLPLSELLIEA